MSANMDTDQLIEWLKSKGVRENILDKLKEEEYDGTSFCMAKDEELAELGSPKLRKGPLTKLTGFRDELKSGARNEASPKPPVTLPDSHSPPPKKKPAPPQQPGHTPPSQSGINSAGYKVVQSNLPAINEAVRLTPSSVDDLSVKFMAKGWIRAGDSLTPKEIGTTALGRIAADPNQFGDFVDMLKNTPGMDIIVGTLESAAQTPSISPPVTKPGATVTKRLPTTHPVYDEKPTIPKLSLLEWTKDGSPQTLRLIQEVAKKWRDLGSAGLGMEESVLNNLEDKFSDVNSCRNVFQRFLQNGSPNYEKPTWGSLIKALRRADMREVSSTLQEALINPL